MTVVPFHVSWLSKPQDEFDIEIDNSNTPFTHPWLPKCGSQPVHPATRYNPLDFAFLPPLPSHLTKPKSIESTLFKLVENVADLDYLATKLSEVEEFAVDLDHNSYHSFQGITCLMQISTRYEDFVVDTLKLWDSIGDYLRDVFQDPSKRKIMHGASNVIKWLQRDFDIYVCNLFDTMQACRVMGLKRNSLEFLLKHYCGVTANKEYQTSDWRIRPLPRDMIKYAREDTHYLLYIHNVMKSTILSNYGQDSLAKVCKLSHEVSSRLYEKEGFDKDVSYLYLYGLMEANLDGKQLAVVCALVEGRDDVAREEDESTGYVLPNKVILEIAKKLPKNKEDLMWIVKYKHDFMDLDYIVKLIKVAVDIEARTTKFEDLSLQLKHKIPVRDIARIVQLPGRYESPERFVMYSIPRCLPIVVNPIYDCVTSLVPIYM
ncbi:protein RRP6-like 1 [Chenopodium quinoa]|uniref:HRDC domain-containing protein n=1 Tax=Chenopodium quinoa TaxID=63459 RepID=A0A803LC69_CHEQI|nr:protein RRP6-like 1 [Chenopodium quinoa]